MFNSLELCFMFKIVAVQVNFYTLHHYINSKYLVLKYLKTKTTTTTKTPKLNLTEQCIVKPASMILNTPYVGFAANVPIHILGHGQVCHQGESALFSFKYTCIGKCCSGSVTHGGYI